MISFRYHVVSLAAVLLALAAGVLLGSGPLQGRVLAPTADDGGVSAAAALADLEDTEALVTDLAAGAATDSLAGQTVAVISLPGANADDVAQVSAALGAAGAAEGQQVTINLEGTSSAYLQTFTQQLAGYLPTPPEASAAEGVLMAAVLASVTGTAGDDGVLEELLVAGDEPLVSVTEGEIATAAVAVGPREASEWDLAGMVRAMAGTPAIVVGATTDAGDGLIDTLRADEAIPTTVNEVDGAAGPALAPLALAAEIAGEHGHWGTGQPSPTPPLVH